MDIYPSLIKLSGAKIDDNIHMDGEDILPLLLENKQMPKRPVFWKIGDNKAIRKDAWKLNKFGSKSPELYNLYDDIGETHNLSLKKPDLVKQLLEEYRLWEQDVTSNYKIK